MNQHLSDVILKNLLDGVLIVDIEGRIVYANPAAEKLFGKPSAELIGKHFGYPVAHQVQEIQLLCNGQILVVEMLAAVIQWDGVDGCLLSFHDITELKKVSKELEEQRQRLEDLNLELQQYASLASHDLKEPVRKIMLYTQRLLSEKFQSAEDIKDQLFKIFNSADRMRVLISGIAEYSRCSEPAESSWVNLNEVMEEVINDLEIAIDEKQAKIEWEPLPTIKAIKIQMHQLFMNLISNSIKYARNDVKPRVRILMKEDEAYVLIKVKDNGIGFDNDYAEKVFQPFRRLHTNQGFDGTGIGLTICKKIVEVHGGEINVNSKQGEGSEFILKLPIAIVAIPAD